MQKIHSVTVKCVSKQQTVNYYINLSLFILESNKTIIIKCIKVNIINKIYVSVILNINELNKKKDNIAL